MVVKENIFHLKKHKLESLFIYILFTIIFLLFSVYISLGESLDYSRSGMKQIYEGKAIFHIIDGYYDGNDFEKFLKKKDSLNILKQFYQGLNTNKNFTYLTMMDQHIGIKGENVKESMILGSKNSKELINDEYYTPIKSLQINQKAVDFFDLELDSGTLWCIDDFNTVSDEVPVILGSNYKDIYKLGDVIKANFYYEKRNFKIIGFLKSNAKILYNNDVEFYLDDYIIVPYINLPEPINENELSFQQKIYFAMVNGYLVTDNNNECTSRMMGEIENISRLTGFTQHSYIGYNSHYNSFQNLIKILEESKNLVEIVLALDCILIIWLSYMIFSLQNRNFKEYYWVHLITGTPFLKIAIIKTIIIWEIILLACITDIYIISHILYIQTVKSNLILFGLVLIIGIILSILTILQSKLYYHRMKGAYNSD